MRSAGDESNLGKGLGRQSGGGFQSAASESKLRSDPRRMSASQEMAKIAADFQANLHQQNIARSGSRIGQVTVDNDDGTYTVALSAGGGTYRQVSATPGTLIFVDGWYTIERQGSGYAITGPAVYQGGND